MRETGRVQVGRSNREGRVKCYKENHDSAGADHPTPEQVLPSSPGTPRTRATERTTPELLVRAGAGRQRTPAGTGNLLGLMRHVRYSHRRTQNRKCQMHPQKLLTKTLFFLKSIFNYQK